MTVLKLLSAAAWARFISTDLLTFSLPVCQINRDKEFFLSIRDVLPVHDPSGSYIHCYLASGQTSRLCRNNIWIVSSTARGDFSRKTICSPLINSIVNATACGGPLPSGVGHHEPTVKLFTVRPYSGEPPNSDGGNLCFDILSSQCNGDGGRVSIFSNRRSLRRAKPSRGFPPSYYRRRPSVRRSALASQYAGVSMMHDPVASSLGYRTRREIDVEIIAEL
jgi:hypothetical protein